MHGLWVCAHVHTCTRMEVRGKLGVSSLLPPCCSLEMNSDHQAWWQAPPPTEPSPGWDVQLLFYLFILRYFLFSHTISPDHSCEPLSFRPPKPWKCRNPEWCEDAGPAALHHAVHRAASAQQGAGARGEVREPQAAAGPPGEGENPSNFPLDLLCVIPPTPVHRGFRVSLWNTRVHLPNWSISLLVWTIQTFWSEPKEDLQGDCLEPW